MKKSIIALAVISTTFVACLSETTNTETENTTQQVETLPLREVKDINFFVEQIKANPEWLTTVEEKAKQQAISLDSMLVLDATYLQLQDVEVVKIEHEIINNPEWLALVKQKAQEQGLSLDEMIRADAVFMNEQNKLAAQPAQ